MEITDEYRGAAAPLHPKRYKIVNQQIFALMQNPRPSDAQMLEANIYRVRVGPYRISYEVDDKQRRVRVFLLEVVEERE